MSCERLPHGDGCQGWQQGASVVVTLSDGRVHNMGSTRALCVCDGPLVLCA